MGNYSLTPNFITNFSAENVQKEGASIMALSYDDTNALHINVINGPDSIRVVLKDEDHDGQYDPGEEYTVSIADRVNDDKVSRFVTFDDKGTIESARTEDYTLSWSDSARDDWNVTDRQLADLEAMALGVLNQFNASDIDILQWELTNDWTPPGQNIDVAQEENPMDDFF